MALAQLPSVAPGSTIVAARLRLGEGGAAFTIGLSDTLGASAAAPALRTLQPGSRVTVELLTMASREGRAVFWHSAAHCLGAALLSELGGETGVHLCDGPAVLSGEGGFFYEFETLGSDPRVVGAAALPALEARVRAVARERRVLERVPVSRAEAEALFASNPHKLADLARVPDGDAITVYRCGDFVDLCRGPHLPHTGALRAMHLYRAGASHAGSGGDESGAGAGAAPAAAAPAAGALLQRVYGVAFPSAAELDAWRSAAEEARRRDHRVLGRAQGLFFFHEASPGSAFFLPHGARVYNRLLSWLRDEYRRRGYEEVITPQLFKRDLWRTSGHLQAYAGDMFAVTPGLPTGDAEAAAAHADNGCCGGGAAAAAPDDDAIFGLKPMNCPGHCLIFKSRGAVSYRELPMRLADFSPLHRNEASGALGGLTRLRRFAQDDAHIFCAPSQVADEVAACLRFVAAVYGVFGFRFRAVLSTRPPLSVGGDAAWAAAEAALADSLRAFLGPGGAPLDVEAGGGAFYGPKIDVFVEDALRREHQCATVQLDFNLPARFGLAYTDSSGATATPVLIHRAVLGSVERMLGVLIEHTGGRWPFWLSPRQVLVASVSERHAAAARAAAAALAPPEAGAAALFVDVDVSTRTVAKKVREAQAAQYNVVAVVGDAEAADGTVSLRFRDAVTRAAFAVAARDVLGEAACPAMPAREDATLSLPLAQARAVLEALARTPAPAPAVAAAANAPTLSSGNDAAPVE